MLKDDFNYFISERIEECLRDLKKNNQYYIKEIEKHHNLYETLSKELEPSYLAKLNDLIDQLLNTVGMEREAIYLTAIKDVKNIMQYNINEIK